MLDLANPAGPIVNELRRYTFAAPVSDEAFTAFADLFPGMDAERDGLYEIVLVTKPGNKTSRLNAKLIQLVGNWNDALPESGVVYDSDTAFRWPDGSLKGPDCSWGSPERECVLEAEDKTYATILPDIVFELRSKTDAWKATTEKCEQWVGMGAVCAIAIDPLGHRIEVKGAAPADTLVTIARRVAGIMDPSPQQKGNDRAATGSRSNDVRRFPYLHEDYVRRLRIRQRTARRNDLAGKATRSGC